MKEIILTDIYKIIRISENGENILIKTDSIDRVIQIIKRELRNKNEIRIEVW